MADLLPRLQIPELAKGQTVDPKALFPRPVQSVWLEVGFGGGEHTAAQAQLHPEVGMIGCEVFRNGIASLLGHVDRDGTADRIRVFPDDVRRLLPAFPDACLGRAFVLFPDPWPKARHAERRFIGAANLAALARVMAPGAELRVASDDPVYVAWATAQLEAAPHFERIQVTGNRAELPEDWPVTRYERKLLAGRPPMFFRYARKAD